MNTDAYDAASSSGVSTTQETGSLAAPRVFSARRANAFAQFFLVAFLLLIPMLRAFRLPCVTDPDIWWHISIGNWILQHNAVPQADFMSRSVGGTPWQAYSWLFDLLTSALSRHFGLAGIVTYTAVMFTLITAACYRLASRSLDFSLSILLTFLAGFSIWPMETPRSWLFTILFALLEVDILMQARKTGKLRGLIWIPIILAFWANLHIQFVHGLILLGVALAESIALHWKPDPAVRTRPFPLACTLVAGTLATLLNPYGWRIFDIAYQFATQSNVLNKISEIQSLPFRDPANYTVLLLAFAVVALLAYKGRPLFFETGLFLVASYFSFHSQRDVWLMAVTACAVLGSSGIMRDRPADQPPRFALPLAICTVLLLATVFKRSPTVQETRLIEAQKSYLPVDAVAYVKTHNLQGPLFNDFNWGGYLYWALDTPVSMDGRVAPYGAERIDRSIATWNAMPDWRSDPLLASANLVIGPVSSPLTQLLRTDARYHLAFEDKVAAVFTANVAKR